MRKRRIVLFVLAAVFVTAAASLKLHQIRGGAAQAASFQPPPDAVTTLKVSTASWPQTLHAIGTVTAVQGVNVSADLPGVVEEILFESGRQVTAGTVLVRLDTRQEQAQLTAAKAQLVLARLNHERALGLAAQGVISPADRDRTQAEFEQAQARVGEIEATIHRKQIRAPFTGLLGLRQVNLGQYLEGGSPIVALQSLDPVYVDFSVPQQQVARMRPGGEVEVALEGLPDAGFRGRISAIDSVVDEATRNVRVRASLDNPGGRLRPGMFVEARVTSGAPAPVLAIPASAISYAPYGDSVFVVADLPGPEGGTYRGVRQQFVKLGPARGDQVVVASGLAAGDEVVTSGTFKLRTGAAVKVDNSVQPANDPAPRPQEN